MIKHLSWFRHDYLVTLFYICPLSIWRTDKHRHHIHQLCVDVLIEKLSVWVNGCLDIEGWGAEDWISVPGTLTHGYQRWVCRGMDTDADGGSTLSSATNTYRIPTCSHSEPKSWIANQLDLLCSVWHLATVWRICQRNVCEYFGPIPLSVWVYQSLA